MKFKRVLSILLVAVLMIGVLPTFSVANAATYGDLEYEIVDGEVTITDCADFTIKSIDIPSQIEGYPVTVIGDYAFYGCTNLASVKIPDSVTTISRQAFYMCEILVSIEIPDSVTTIGDYAFMYCDSLVSITIPDSVTIIGKSVFYECTSLVNIAIGGSVTTIGEMAFSDCSGLVSITIPDSVTTIGEMAFWGCSSLTDICVGENNLNFTSSDGVLYNKSKTELLCCPAAKSGGFSIPDSVTTIGNHAFSDCESIECITIPDGVTTIGDWAFSSCKSLKSITIPDGVTTIADSVFLNCTDLVSITIPDGVTAIGDNAFWCCYSLENIVIPDSVTTIGDSAFLNCTDLVSITIPDSITAIGNSAFSRCYNLVSITIPNGVTIIGDYTFSHCTSLASITIPHGVTVIGERAFFGSTGLKTVTYIGAEQDRANIQIGDGNSELLNAAWTYHVHSFDNECDANCNDCGSTREPPHSWSTWIYNADDGTETRTCSACGESETRDITENPTYRPDEHMPFVTLNDAGNGVVLDHNKSWATRVYWGCIGEEFVEYKWFDDDFRLLCGTDYFADYSPKAGETYNFTKPGWYRFVVKGIRTGTTVEDYTYSELVFDFYYDGSVAPTVPTITELGNNQIKINTNGTAIKKFYYGNIGQTNVPYSWFNSFWGTALETKTYTPVFDNREGRIITLQTKGYYNIIIVDTNNNEYVYTVYADGTAPVVKKADGESKAIVDIDILKGNVGTKATMTKLYYGYLGTEDKEISTWADFIANVPKRVAASNVAQGTTYNLSNKGYYKFYAVMALSNGRTIEVVYTIDNN